MCIPSLLCMLIPFAWPPCQWSDMILIFVSQHAYDWICIRNICYLYICGIYINLICNLYLFLLNKLCLSLSVWVWVWCYFNYDIQSWVLNFIPATRTAPLKIPEDYIGNISSLDQVIVCNVSALCGLFMPYGIANIGQPWLRWCLAASHYLNRFRLIVNWTPTSKVQWNLKFTNFD